MKLAVVFDFKEGMTPERAQNLALNIAVMVNASVRGESDVTVNINPDFFKDDFYGLPEPLASILEKK